MRRLVGGIQPAKRLPHAYRICLASLEKSLGWRASRVIRGYSAWEHPSTPSSRPPRRSGISTLHDTTSSPRRSGGAEGAITDATRLLSSTTRRALPYSSSVLGGCWSNNSDPIVPYFLSYCFLSGPSPTAVFVLRECILRID